MKKSILIGLVVVLLIGGGAAAYFMTRDKDNKKSTKTSDSRGTNKPNTNEFSPVSTTGLAYEAVISSEENGSTTNQATIKNDGKGVTQYSSAVGGQATEITITADAYYTCAAGQCIKYPSNQSNSAFDPSTYAYTDAQLLGYRSGATFKGKQSCPSGSCDTWSISANGSTSTLFIDSETKRITQVETTVQGKTSKIVYSYKDVSITVPANATDLPTTIPQTP